MKICIYGAGAIGGYLSVELALAGFEVTSIARGPHLEAIRRNGLTLLTEGDRKVAKMAPLLGPDTAIITAQNGIPWWYFYELSGRWKNQRLQRADPGGLIWDTLGPRRAIGCVVYPSCELVEPGVVQHVSGNRLMLGEPDGSKSERAVALSKALTTAGFKAPVRPNIRDDIWLKLWGNVSFNPVSVLTHATLEQICGDDGVRAVVRAMMVEAQRIGKELGVTFKVDVETRIGWAADVGAHKTSMLQDLEMGRPMEIDALVGTVAEMGRLVGVDTPTIDTVLDLVRLRSRIRS